MLSSTKKDSLFIAFSEQLGVSGVSKNTLKNYRSDLALFESWLIPQLKVQGIQTSSLRDCLPFLSPDISKAFKIFLTESSSQNTVNRRLSTLRALSRFLVGAQLSDFDFMQGVLNLGSEGRSELASHPALSDFQKHLETEKVSKNTVRNYVSDIKHFLSWLEANQ